MEYAKDEVFSISYNKNKDKHSYPLFKKIAHNIVGNKFITLLITMGILFSILNFTLIYYFFKILNTII